ncbi:reverse transcriptase [Plakobranchus ocellatus]|uniref:Reverse transcriptase n=1 Tax=Plakobranchus ocellatus TaxID=259542 RepID=A0AAV3XRK3_9GAST|nr:reverse transcriptase [Plakobranchus ocellatus]
MSRLDQAVKHGDYSMLTKTAPRTTRTRTTNVGLEMDYSCTCGRRFATERGMEIHRTKMGCLSMSSQQQRTAIADKTLENQSQVQNHSAKEIQAENRNDVLRHPSSDKRHKINFPPASSGKQWEDLDSKIVLKIDSLLGKSTLEYKLASFGDIVYQTCLDTFGAKQHLPKCPPQRRRRQLEMDILHKQNRKRKKQIRAASSEETDGLLVIWRQLKARHSALSRAESARKKRSQKRKNQERFIRDPFQFARQLFQQPKSRSLTVDREELETNLKKTYSDPTPEIPLEETTGLVWPAASATKFESKPPSLQEVIAVVNKARAKSAPGPNGVPYLLYKRCPKVLKKLHKILRSAWTNIKISKEWMKAEGVYIPKEQDSKGINQFRPISVLNVEGKIFFSVMASLLTKYLTENGYIDTSVQKGGIPGISGCLEHATIIWEAIQRAKSEKLNIDVIWLDLASAYGSVLHEMIQLALIVYHVLEVIQVMLDDYFSGFRMRFSTNNYTTSWINLEVNCYGMHNIPNTVRNGHVSNIESSRRQCRPANLGVGCSMPRLKAFMDDTTIICSKEDETRRMLTSLDVT